MIIEQEIKVIEKAEKSMNEIFTEFIVLRKLRRIQLQFFY